MDFDTWVNWSLLLANVVTIIGLPFAIIVFLLEKRKEALNEDEEIYQRLSDDYDDFQKLVLEHIDLRLLDETCTQGLSEEQRARMFIIFDLLVSIFERAFILVYEERLPKQRQRMWASWADYMREWIRRDDFFNMLPELLRGEDPEFARYLLGLVREERGVCVQIRERPLRVAPQPTAAAGR